MLRPETMASRSYEEVRAAFILVSPRVLFTPPPRPLLPFPLLLHCYQIIREPYDYICQVKGKEIRVKLIEVSADLCCLALMPDPLPGL